MQSRGWGILLRSVSPKTYTRLEKNLKRGYSFILNKVKENKENMGLESNRRYNKT